MCVADDVLVLSSAGPIVGLYQSLGSTLSMRTLVIPGDSSISCSVSQSVSQSSNNVRDGGDLEACRRSAGFSCCTGCQAGKPGFVPSSSMDFFEHVRIAINSLQMSVFFASNCARYTSVDLSIYRPIYISIDRSID